MADTIQTAGTSENGANLDASMPTSWWDGRFVELREQLEVAHREKARLELRVQSTETWLDTLQDHVQRQAELIAQYNEAGNYAFSAGCGAGLADVVLNMIETMRRVCDYSQQEQGKVSNEPR